MSEFRKYLEEGKNEANSVQGIFYDFHDACSDVLDEIREVGEEEEDKTLVRSANDAFKLLDKMDAIYKSIHKIITKTKF